MYTNHLFYCRKSCIALHDKAFNLTKEFMFIECKLCSTEHNLLLKTVLQGC